MLWFKKHCIESLYSYWKTSLHKLLLLIRRFLCFCEVFFHTLWFIWTDLVAGPRASQWSSVDCTLYIASPKCQSVCPCTSLYAKKGLFSLTEMSCTWLCLQSTCWLQGASFSNTESGFQRRCNYTGPNINIQGVLTIDLLLIIFRPKSLMMHHHFLNQLNMSNSKPHRNIYIKFAEQHKKTN